MIYGGINMMINFWYCEYRVTENENTRETNNYDWCYHCSHPDGDGSCDLENKWGGDIDNCRLLDKIHLVIPTQQKE